jgi:hypothetical protein
MQDGPATPSGGKQDAIRVHADCWPLIYVSFHGSSDGPMFDRYLDELTRALRLRSGPRAMVMDASECSYVSAAARKKQAEWMRMHDQDTREFTRGVAFILPSSLLRGALTAVLWLQPLSCPHAIVKDAATALARCQSWLEPNGLAFTRDKLPPQLLLAMRKSTA